MGNGSRWNYDGCDMGDGVSCCEVSVIDQQLGT